MAFKGIGLVAFIDVLGFSARVEETWDLENSALDQLLALKQQLLTFQYPTVVMEMSGGQPRTPSRPPEISTVSDSIVLKHAFNNGVTNVELEQAFATMCSAINIIREFAMYATFPLRGSFELGPIYWDDDEIIGPAFNAAYVLESKVAKTARIIMGPGLLEWLAEHPPADGRMLMWNLFRSSDGLLSLKIHSKFIPSMTQMQSNAGNVADKYDEALLAMKAAWDLNGTQPDDWRAAAVIARQRLDGVRFPGGSSAREVSDRRTKRGKRREIGRRHRSGNTSPPKG